MTTLLWVALGSALGAPARYLLDRLVQSRHAQVLPWGTLVVNLTGSFLLGVLVAAAPRHGVDAWVTATAGIGFLGSYTTFSTFTWESVRLVEDGKPVVAVVNVALSIGVGAVAAGGGLLLGSAL
jgi:fluoride exporter